MAPYYPVTVCRSDGLLEVITKSGIRELNQPTPDQLSDKPDANGNVDCYKRLDVDDPKAVDWRRKLGGMMMHLLGGKAHSDRNYILSELPEGYVLWEHVKYNIKQLAEEKKKEKGKHAAGMFERQDSYLYGHPQGRKKRFRSPADFFPHVLWLATDKEGNARNCSCKICSPDPKKGDEDLPEEVKNEAIAKKEIKPVPASSPAVVKNTPTPNTAPAMQSRPPQASTNSVQSQEKTTDGDVNGRYVSPPPTTESLLAARPTRSGPNSVISQEKLVDADPNGRYLYRPGEVVWFNNGANWRLGVIGRRGLMNNNPRYLIQPLSNPYQPQVALVKDDEATLRPWLAWSVPDTTIPQIKDYPYDRVPWDRITKGDFDAGQRRDYVVDGSILAAKVVDASYSFFDRNELALVGLGEVHYNGMFLGAEKIWVGEPVRLRVPTIANVLPEIVVLIIHKMIERPSTASVQFIGDVYKFVEMPTPYKNRSQWPTPDLPPRMVADLRFRNEVADDAKRGTWYEWRLLEPAARKSLIDIKGRWYETRTLLPILRGLDKYQEDIAKGKLGDAGAWMNGRRDNNKVPEERKKNRKDTLGQAVPADFKVSRGLDGFAADNLFPDETMDIGGFMPNDLDQFMNLDPGQDFYGM